MALGDFFKPVFETNHTGISILHVVSIFRSVTKHIQQSTFSPPNFGPKLQDRDIHLAWREVSHMWIRNAVSARNPWGFWHVELEIHCSCSTQWFFVPILRWIETFVESTTITNNQPLFHQAGTTDLNHFNQHPVSIFTKLIKTNLFVWWGEPIGSKLQPLISVCIVQLTTLSLYINSWGEFSESWPLGKFLHDQSS